MSCEVGIDPKLHNIEGQFMSSLEHITFLRLDGYPIYLVIYRELESINSLGSIFNSPNNSKKCQMFSLINKCVDNTKYSSVS